MELEKPLPVPATAYFIVSPSSRVGPLDKQWEMANRAYKALENFSKEPQEFLLEGYFDSADFRKPYLKSEDGPGTIRFPGIIGKAGTNPDFKATPLMIDSGIYYGSFEDTADFLWVIIYPGSYRKTDDLEKCSKFCRDVATSVLGKVVEPFYTSSLGYETGIYGAFIGDFFPSISMAKRSVAKSKDPAGKFGEWGLNVKDILEGEPLSPEESKFLELTTKMDEYTLRKKMNLRRPLKKKKIPVLRRHSSEGPYQDSYMMISKIKTQNALYMQGLNYAPKWAEGPIDPQAISETVRSDLSLLFEHYRVAGLESLLLDFKVQVDSQE